MSHHSGLAVVARVGNLKRTDDAVYQHFQITEIVESRYETGRVSGNSSQPSTERLGWRRYASPVFASLPPRYNRGVSKAANPSF